MKSARHSQLRQILQKRVPLPQFGSGGRGDSRNNRGSRGSGRGRGGPSGPIRGGITDSKTGSSDRGTIVGSIVGVGGGLPNSVNDDVPVVQSSTSLPQSTIIGESQINSPLSTASSSTTSTSPSILPSASPSSSIQTTSSSTNVTVTSTSGNIGPSVAAAVDTTVSSTQALKSHINAGALVGGIFAGIIAIAVILVAVAFYLRRRRRKAEYFDPSLFRRSAMVVGDTSPDADDQGLMSEKQTRESLGPAYSVASGYVSEKHVETSKSNFAAGQTVDATPTSFSSHSTPMVEEFNETYQTPQPYPLHFPFPSNEQATSSWSPSIQSDVTIRPSTQARELTRDSSTPRDTIPPDDFVDLTRCSVSPFQAAQSLTISERLNSQTPPITERALPPLPPPQETRANTASPFDDPEPPVNKSGGDLSRSESLSNQSVSGDSIVTEALKFPLPPSPSHAPITRYRADSLPPTLPDINVQTRVSMPTAMMRHSKLGSITTYMFSSLLATADGSSTPSPPPEADITEASTPAVEGDQALSDQSRVSTYSLEDAYGGY